MIRKITDGYVIQTYDENGKPVSQEFIAGKTCEWEKDEGDKSPFIESPETATKFVHFPFYMVQPQDMVPVSVEPIVSEVE